jgi:ATP-dependent RNA helicase DHX37/DHR1
VLQAMEEIHKLRAQISHIAQANFPGTGVDFTPQLRPPNALQVRRACGGSVRVSYAWRA